MMTRRFPVVLAALLLTPGVSLAQGTSDGPFPSRTVTIVVPTGPSGQTDVFARLIAEQLRSRLGQPFVVENKPGAGGSVAGRYLASRPADGYTLMYGSMSTIIIAPHLQKPLAYDSTKAFAPIALTQSGSSPLTVRASLAFQSARDLVEYARKNPGKINFASQGVGSVGHLAMELLSSKTDIKMTHVPFSGTGAGIAAMLGGQVDVIIADILTSRPHVQSGTLRYISQLASQRSPRHSRCPYDGRRAERAGACHGLLARLVRPGRDAGTDHPAAQPGGRRGDAGTLGPSAAGSHDDDHAGDFADRLLAPDRPAI